MIQRVAEPFVEPIVVRRSFVRAETACVIAPGSSRSSRRTRDTADGPQSPSPTSREGLHASAQHSAHSPSPTSREGLHGRECLERTRSQGASDHQRSPLAPLQPPALQPQGASAGRELSSPPSAPEVTSDTSFGTDRELTQLSGSPSSREYSQSLRAARGRISVRASRVVPSRPAYTTTTAVFMHSDLTRRQTKLHPPCKTFHVFCRCSSSDGRESGP